MAWTNYQKILALVMVVTGSFNTLSVKYADNQSAAGEDGESRPFNHPFMQSAFMFLGEMLCLLTFKIAYAYYKRKNDDSAETSALTKGNKNFNPIILLIPAFCDMIATSIMYVGLNLTFASSFQMLRGSVIVFTAFLSMGFLEKEVGAREWTGIGFVILGLALVGISDLMMDDGNSRNTNSILTGDLLIICAQVIISVQMVIEEKFVTGLDIPPLQAVGWEGVFGFIGICLAMIPLNYIHTYPPFADNSQGTLEAPIDALIQIGNSGRLLMAITGITLSIAFFNFAGISVTKEMSATTRMILDSVRTIVIWGFSLAFKWQDFHYLQLIGFWFLLIGMGFYNNVGVPQLCRKILCKFGRHQPPEMSNTNDRAQIINAVDEPDPEGNR